MSLAMSDDEDDDKSQVVDKHLGKLAERMDAARDTTEVEVQDEEPEEREPEEPAPGRKQRRADRYKTVAERAAAAEARAEALQEQLEVARRERAERPPERQRQNPVEDIDAKIRANYKRTEELHDEWQRKQGKMSAAEESRLRDLAVELDVEKGTLIVERRETLHAPQRESERKVAELRSSFPDVFENPAAVRYAQGVWQQRQARGEPDTRETVDACFEEARVAILGKRPKPDPGQRQRATGMSGGSRGPSPASEKVTLNMTKGSPLYLMAVAQYPKDDPKVACQKWANSKGKAYQAAASKR